MSYRGDFRAMTWKASMASSGAALTSALNALLGGLLLLSVP
jgi:hypothetical protein